MSRTRFRRSRHASRWAFLVLLAAAAALASTSVAAPARADAPPGVVVQSIKQGDTLHGQVQWVVTAVQSQGLLTAAEYWANNVKLATVSGNGVFEYTLDTTKLPEGRNNLGMVLEYADGSKSYPGLGWVTVENGTAPPPDPWPFPMPPPLPGTPVPTPTPPPPSDNGQVLWRGDMET